MADHKGHLGWCDIFGRYYQVAFVFAVGAVKDDYEFVVSLLSARFSGLVWGGGRRGRRGRGEEGVGEKWESIRKASIVSIMESNWRASEDAWSLVRFVMGLGWTPFRMGDAAGGIM